jgi:hypothetical protein
MQGDLLVEIQRRKLRIRKMGENRSVDSKDHGCQIFVGTIYQNGENCTKLLQNLQNNNQMAK